MSDSPDSSVSDLSLPELETAIDGLAGVPELLAAAMRRRGFEELTSVQRAVLDADSGQRDLRISSQTGSGKTVAIGFALAEHLTGEAAEGNRTSPSVLVLVPTRELAMQVREELSWLFAGTRKVAVEVVMGGTSLHVERRALGRRPQIVVGTPGRTLDHLKTGALRCHGVEHVVLDESDRMLEMGFREELEAILEQLPEERRTHLVSATFASQVRRLADRFQKDAVHIEGTRLGAANVDIQHLAHVTGPRDTYPALVNLLLLNEGKRCLVFVERRIDASKLADRLSGDGFPVHAFSGDLAQSQRTRTLDAFRDGTIKTLVSTDVAARGIDVPDIELVIHLDPPGDADSYVHRSGRTGRAGRTGRSVMLVPPEAQRHVARILKQARIEPAWTPAPNATRVRKQLRKRFRQLVHEGLGAESAPSQQEMDYAKGLLDGRDPAEVVAFLLALAQPKPSCEPREVREATVPDPRESQRARRAAPGFVRFRINWGERGGAAQNRILAHVCRRGQIRGNQVGSIEIDYDTSSFDIAENMASEFEKRVRRPDARDPKLRIDRIQGSRAGGGGGARDSSKPRRGLYKGKRGAPGSRR
ncbi:MAG: DEAD/DEAH box helicase [Myxococcales bacterium]|nr:DEAD/DEAH box helicase [Myxococcales bacterium]